MIEPVLEVDDIQGHSLRGFDTPFLTLVGLRIGQAQAARSWLTALSGRLDTLRNVHHYRITRSFAPVRAPRTLLNLALSAHGLDRLGTNVSTVEDGFFLNPMGVNAAALGDAIDAASNPTEYVIGDSWESTPDILMIVGGDTAEVTTALVQSLRSAASMAGCSVTFEQTGNLLPGEVEHFGFRDGISQVGPRGRLSTVADDYLTLRFISKTDPVSDLFAKPGQPLVWPGQFVFGYPTQLPATPLEPGPESDGGAPWMRNGSFLVFRRLRQDISVFNSFLRDQSQDLSRVLGRGVTPEEVGAQLVGRWKDGSPTIITPTGPDPLVSGDEMIVNGFAYGEGTPPIVVLDVDGKERQIAAQPDDHLAQRCPFFSHIRKVNPRDLATDQGIAGRTLTFQMLRRGIPYGPPFAAGAEAADRGLLFLAYQTSFKRQFNVLNSLWMNNSSAPEVTNEGHDMLLGQTPAGTERFGLLRDRTGGIVAKLATQDRWVQSTGGGFFFAPSISYLKALS